MIKLGSSCPMPYIEPNMLDKNAKQKYPVPIRIIILTPALSEFLSIIDKHNGGKTLTLASSNRYIEQ